MVYNNYEGICTRETNRELLTTPKSVSSETINFSDLNDFQFFQKSKRKEEIKISQKNPNFKPNPTSKTPHNRSPLTSPSPPSPPSPPLTPLTPLAPLPKPTPFSKGKSRPSENPLTIPREIQWQKVWKNKGNFWTLLTLKNNQYLKPLMGVLGIELFHIDPCIQGIHL